MDKPNRTTLRPLGRLITAISGFGFMALGVTDAHQLHEGIGALVFFVIGISAVISAIVA